MPKSRSGLDLSKSASDCLKVIHALSLEEAASTSEIAGALGVAPASVSNMLVRLSDDGLVSYEPYRGAALTARGEVEALRLLRRHRLVETFMIERLGYARGEVIDGAERLGHAISDRFTEALAELLGHPSLDPHGNPIPSPDGITPGSLVEVEISGRARSRELATLHHGEVPS